MAEIIYSLSLLTVLIVVIMTIFHERFTKISASPVMPWVFERAMALLAQETDADKAYKIADLGCGWGGTLLRLAKIYPFARITGYELSPWPFLISEVRTIFHKQIQVSRVDFYQESLSELDIV